MSNVQYCSQADVIDRTLILTADVVSGKYQSAIDYAINEASRTVDDFLLPYYPAGGLPFNGHLPEQTSTVGNGNASVPDQIVIVTADFAASIFKRRLNPNELRIRGGMQPDMINDVDGTGWFAMALKKLQEFIKATFGLGAGFNNPPVNLASSNVLLGNWTGQNGIGSYSPPFTLLGTTGVYSKALSIPVASITSFNYEAESSDTEASVVVFLFFNDGTTASTEQSLTTSYATYSLLSFISGYTTKVITQIEFIGYTPNSIPVYVTDPTLIYSTAIFNPKVFADLFKRGIITLKEARQYMADANVAVENILTELITRTVTEIQSITKTMYPTKRQKAFAFISGKHKPNIGGYELDSETSGDT